MRGDAVGMGHLMPHFTVPIEGFATYKVLKVITKKLDFNARSWNNETAVKYVFETHDGLKIESMVLFHFLDKTLKDLTIEISSMYGCPVGCKFCSSGGISPIKKLSARNFLEQVNTCLQHSEINPNNYENFFVSFAGLGEPSVVAEEITTAAYELVSLYPHVKFNIPTFGFRSNCFEIWERCNIPIRTIQLPYFHYGFTQQQNIASGLSSSYKFHSVIEKAARLTKSIKDCRLKINYLAISGFNDNEEDVVGFTKLMEEFRKTITVRISYLNSTPQCVKSGFISSPKTRMEAIGKKLCAEGYDVYLFGTEDDCGLGCGQTISRIL